MEEEKKEAPKVKSGQDDTLLAVLATIPLIGLVIYFGMSSASKLVKNYAKQSIGLLGLWIVAVVIGFIPVLGWLISCLLGLTALVAWVLLVINALQGNTYKLPVLGDFVDGILKD